MALENTSLKSTDYGKKIAAVSLEIGSIKLSPEDPFTWASGYRMPIYNDNRLLLRDIKHRFLVAEGFEHLIKSNNISYDLIAGTATAGIPHSTTLANLLKCPLVYIREKPKGHGLRKQIEGTLYEGEKVIVIEDLVSTGGSLISNIEGVRNAGGIVDYCFSIFSYDFETTKEKFADAKCTLLSLLTYSDLLEVAVEKGYIKDDSLAMLKEWRNAPFEWGEKHGFPKVDR